MAHPPLSESASTPAMVRVAYTIAEISALTGIGKTTIWSEIKREKLQAVRLGNRCTRITPAAVKSWLEQAAQPPEISASRPASGRRGR